MKDDIVDTASSTGTEIASEAGEVGLSSANIGTGSIAGIASLAGKVHDRLIQRAENTPLEASDVPVDKIESRQAATNVVFLLVAVVAVFVGIYFVLK
jgi:hypothetical protein